MATRKNQRSRKPARKRDSSVKGNKSEGLFPDLDGDPAGAIWVPIDALCEDPRNARDHDEPTRSIAAIKASLAEFGQVTPIVVDRKRVVRKGNGVLRAARELGWDRIMAIPTEHSGNKATAYAIADNRTAELSRWKRDVFESQVRELQAAGQSLESMGFTCEEFESQLDQLNAGNPPPAINEDEVPEPPSDPITKPGDLWILGDHRLLCGDATSAEDVEMVLGGNEADLFVTDPPYGVSYAGKNAFLNAIDKGNHNQTEIEHDHESVEDMSALWIAAFSMACAASKKGACYYVTGPQGGELAMMMMALCDSGWLLKHVLIWAKNNHVLGRCDYNYKHEPILYGWKPGAGHFFAGEGPSTSLWEYDRPHRSEDHPTMKPVALVAAMVTNGSRYGERVLDPFSGSGTTLVAAEQLGRRCAAIEIEPRYCDVAVARWEKLTGRKAELESSATRFPRKAKGVDPKADPRRRKRSA